jgi:hypothetical protein
MSENVGTAIDDKCFDHLKMIIAAHPDFFPG